MGEHIRLEHRERVSKAKTHNLSTNKNKKWMRN